MADPRVTALFEATFLNDPYATKADILVRSRHGWKLLEVKSGIHPREDYVDDLAYTLMVVRRAGVNINAAGLVLLSPDFRLGMADGDLFIEYDLTKETRAKADTFEDHWEAVAASALAEHCPVPRLIFDCRGCSFFGVECHVTDEPHHIFDLPRLSRTGFERLTKLSVTAIDRIPRKIRLTPAQERVRKAVVSGKPLVFKTKLAKFLRQVEWPAYYLDFETVKSAIPLFATTAPHEQIVTQYSLHRCESPGKISDHREFLADPSGDRRRELAEKLLADLGDHGSIIVYSSFEKTVLGTLARLFPDLRKPLQRCIPRLFDLEKAFRDHIYHPRFRGRTSIKFTLPALTDMSYDGLDIGNGDTAVAKYARMVRQEIVGTDAESVRKGLLEYCRQDTHAMVRLHEELARHAGLPISD